MGGRGGEPRARPARRAAGHAHRARRAGSHGRASSIAHFPLDIFQTGSGTSTNMNVNEVIANRCSQIAGKPVGSKDPVHPNDHVNMGQSSNDVIPTAIHVAVGRAHPQIPPARAGAARMARSSARRWSFGTSSRSAARTSWTPRPVRLGQEFGGYAKQVEYSRLRAGNAIAALEELPLGGTAVGTGLNCHPDFAGMRRCSTSGTHTGIAFREARNHFEAQSAKDGLVQASGQLKTIAVSASSRSPTTSAGSAAARAAASAKSSFPRRSPAAPSCPAR